MLFKVKKHLYNGLAFGLMMSVFFIVRNLMDIEDFNFKSIFKVFAIGIFAGLVAGFLFGLFIRFYKPK